MLLCSVSDGSHAFRYTCILSGEPLDPHRVGGLLLLPVQEIFIAFAGNQFEIRSQLNPVELQDFLGRWLAPLKTEVIPPGVSVVGRGLIDG